MPSTDPNKYILHPLEPLTVPEALLTAFCGLLVVFMMLAMLMVVIYVISWVVQQIESKRKPVAAPAKAAPKPAAPKPAAAPAQDESELVAVMMAAVAEESGMPMGSFQITNIAPAVAAAPAVAIPAPVAAPAPAPCGCRTHSRRSRRWRDCSEEPHAGQYLQGGVLRGPNCQRRRCPRSPGGHEDGN